MRPRQSPRMTQPDTATAPIPAARLEIPPDWGSGLLQLWGVVGPYHLAVAHFQAGEPVGRAGVVVETHDGPVGVGYVQAWPGPGLVNAAVRDVQPVAPGGDVLQD